MKKIFLSGLLCFCAMSASALQQSDLKISTFDFGDQAFCQGVSANGRYALYCGYAPDNSLYYHHPHVIDLQTGKTYDPIEGMTVFSAGLVKISNTGLAVGTLSDKNYLESPAVWSPEKGWQTLPYPKGEWEGGRAEAVSADGRYVAGKVYAASMMVEYPALWCLDPEPKLMDYSGAPTTNPGGSQATQVRFTDVSNDGRYVTGIVDYSYGGSSFIYDTQTKRYQWNGGDPAVLPGEVKYWSGFTPSKEKMLVTAEDANGMYAAYYNLADGSWERLPAGEGGEGLTTFNDRGVYFDTTPANSIVREWSVRKGKYWVQFNQILKQVFNTDLVKLTGYQEDVYSGTVMGVDADGYTIGVMILPNSGESYVVELPKPIDELAAQVDLLADFTSSPASGSSFSILRDLTLRFTRPVEVVADAQRPMIQDEEGNVVATAIKFTPVVNNESEVQISFRSFTMEPGKKYEIVIAKGSLQLPNDPETACGELRFSYTGREKSPVKMISMSPSADTPLPKFSLSESPLLLTFDTEIIPGELAGGSFYRLSDELGEEYLCDIAIATAGNQALVYPVLDQLMFAEQNYRLTIDAGSFTDITGNCPSEEITINLIGAYKREFDPSDLVIFADDFDDGLWTSNFMFLEGDHNQPSSQMINWGFLNGDQYPWWCVRSTEESTDWALCSHSMYSPAGASDDWLVTPQLYLPDAECRLSFKSQSYLPDKKDRLKVLLLATDIAASSMTEAFTELFRQEGVVIYDELQSPGENPETLENEWLENTISLADYAGKYVYIAFVNQNDDQSAIFLDDVSVNRDSRFLFTLDTETDVVKAERAEIKGRLRMQSGENPLPGVSLALLDGDNRKIDELTFADPLEVGKDVEFSFTQTLPLEQGVANAFSIALSATEGDAPVSYTFLSYINNMAFSPVRRSVLEEGTGMGCPNCPLGHIMIEKLLDAHGDRFIPLALHTYTGDVLGGGLIDYANFLGINAYPMAAIDRTGNYSPMASNGSKFMYTGYGEPLWWDVVASHLGAPAQVAISFQEGGPVYNVEARQITLPVTLTFPIERSGLAYNLLTVITEDGLEGYQQNNLFNQTDEVLGEWGQGGTYGRPNVRPFTFNHVVRAVGGATYAGTPGLVPSQVSASQGYNIAFNMPLPDNIAELANCHAVVMVIDASSGEIVNAVSSPMSPGAGISDIMDGEARNDVYSLEGVRLLENVTLEQMRNALQQGIYVFGKQVIVIN